MMAPRALELYVRLHQEHLLMEATAERLADKARQRRPNLRRRLARSLYSVAVWLSADVAESRGEYWPASPVPLRH